MERVDKILKFIEENHIPGKRLVIAIEGKCGTGKTYLSDELSRRLDCSIVHTDDFFLPFEMKTPDRMSQPGGNIFYERMLTDVFYKLGEPAFSYHAYDCLNGKLRQEAVIVEKDIVIVEGVYSLRPEFRKYYDKCYVLAEALDVRLDRLRKRETPEKFQMFLDKWMVLEDRYYEYYDFSDIEHI